MTTTAAATGSIDVSGLPEHAFGTRSPIWWALLLLVTIEAMAMGALLASLLYVRGNQPWPPSFAGEAAFRLAAAQVVILVLSTVPMVLTVRSSRRERLRATRWWLAVTTILGVAALVARGLEIPRVAVRWDANVFGSLYWMVLGMHVSHVLTGVLENVMLLVLFYAAAGKVQPKHFADVEATALLWFLCVAEWVPAFVLLHVEPVLRAR